MADSLTEPHRLPALDIVCPTPETAMALTGTARRLGITTKTKHTRDTDRVTVREPDAITALLTHIGAPDTAAAWAQQRTHHREHTPRRPALRLRRRHPHPRHPRRGRRRRPGGPGPAHPRRGARTFGSDELTPASGSFITARVRASPSSGTLRYRVARLTPRTWATSVTGVFSPIIFRACFNFAGLNTVGPAEAATLPSRGQPGEGALLDEFPFEAGKGPEHVKDQPPAGGGGVNALLHRFEAHSPGFQLPDGLDQMWQRPTQPVQAPHHQRVPRPQVIKHRRQLRTVSPATAGGVRPNPGTPRGPQRVLLQHGGLLRGGHPRITQKLAHAHTLLHNPPTSHPVKHRFRTVLLQHPAVALTCRPILAAAVLL